MMKKEFILFLFAFFQIFFAFASLTSLQYIVSSLFVILAAAYFFKREAAFFLDRRLVFLIVLFLVLYLASTFFSHSIPLSVESFLQFFTSLSIFLIILSLGKDSLFSKTELVITLMLVGFALSLFFVFFLLLPESNDLLPPINIFTFISGHSHFAAYLIMFIPLTWWLVLSGKFTNIKNTWLLLLSQYVLLILTFARGAQLIVLAQTVIIYWLFLRNESKLKLEKVVVYLFVFASLLYIVISSLTGLENCFLENRKDQFCKYYEGGNIRLTYFEQSLNAIEDHMFFGYGPGTYSLINDKYHQVGSFPSVYAHNFYLQLAAESGMIATLVMLLLISYILRYGFIVVKASLVKNNINLFLYIAFVSSCINSLFDFDWHMFQVFQLTLVFGALLLWDFKLKEHTRDFSLYMKFIFGFFAVVFAINATVHYLIVKREFNAAFDVFPYLHMYSNYYDLGENLSPVRKQEYFELHKNHPDVVIRYIENTEDIQQRKSLYHHLESIMPWYATSSSYQEFLYSNSFFTELGEVSLRAIDYLEEYEELRGNNLRKTKAQSIQYLFESAQYQLLDGNTEGAAKYFKGVADVFHSDLHRKDVHYIYQDLIYDDFKWADSYYDFLINLYRKDPTSAESIVRDIYYNSLDQGGSEFFVNELAKISYMIANKNFENMNYENAAEFYIMAAYFEPWILNFSSPLFVNEDRYQLAQDKIVFWNAMLSFPDNSYIDYSGYAAGQYMDLLEQSLLNSDINLVEKYMHKAVSINSWTVSEYEFSLLPQLQKKANTLLMNENHAEAKRYIAVIAMFDAYRARQQLANYYLMIGDIQSATAEYIKCNELWREDRGYEHVFCKQQLNESLLQTQEHYWDTSDAILLLE